MSYTEANIHLLEIWIRRITNILLWIQIQTRCTRSKTLSNHPTISLNLIYKTLAWFFAIQSRAYSWSTIIQIKISLGISNNRNKQQIAEGINTPGSVSRIYANQLFILKGMFHVDFVVRRKDDDDDDDSSSDLRCSRIKGLKLFHHWVIILMLARIQTCFPRQKIVDFDIIETLA